MMKMLEQCAGAQVEGASDTIRAQVHAELMRRTAVPFVGIAMSDAKAGEPVTILITKPEEQR